MPDVAGRRRAVFVGLSVAAIVLSVIPFTVSSATAPPGINRFLYALGQVESGGNYYARNVTQRGLRQVSDHAVELAELGQALRRQLDRPLDPDQPGEGRLGQGHRPLELARHLGERGPLVADRVGCMNRAHWSTYSKSFVAKVMKIYANVSETTAAADVMAAPPAPPTPPPPPLGRVVVETRRIGETNVGVAYTGRWGGGPAHRLLGRGGPLLERPARP